MTEKKSKNKKLKGVVADANSDPKTLKEALIKALEEQGIKVKRNK
jgi:cobalamin biosynthesis protein CbiG|tara:strand:- start:143 stop:277 length:135 start_codon:yes stop_codon:yes gene_type:complete